MDESVSKGIRHSFDRIRYCMYVANFVTVSFLLLLSNRVFGHFMSNKLIFTLSLVGSFALTRMQFIKLLRTVVENNR